MLNLKPLKGLKGLKGLPRLKSLGKAERIPPLPTLGEQPRRVAALVDDEILRLTNQLGDEALAKRVLKLQKKWPKGTTPELVVMDFLERRRVTYGFQVWVIGGRKIKGGQVLDFVVDQGRNVHIWEVQGMYWHLRQDKLATDAAQRMALMGIRIWGKKVGAVVELWDSRLATDNRAKRSQVMEAAMQGRELGP